MRLSEALDSYLLQLDADGRSLSTRLQYARHIRLLLDWLGDPEIDAVGHEDLARFLISDFAKLRPDGKQKKATAMNVMRSSLRTFWGWAHAAGFVASNPARLIRRARCGGPPPRGLSDPEQERLMAVLRKADGEAAERDNVLFGLMLATGIRLGSALGLDVEDVDADAGELFLRRFKGDRVEIALLPWMTADLLISYLGERTTGPVFRSRHCRRLSARQAARRFRMWCERAGVRRRGTHGLRHSFAARLYKRTGDILLVKDALRHRSVVSTLAYASCGALGTREALSTMGSRIEPAHVPSKQTVLSNIRTSKIGPTGGDSGQETEQTRERMARTSGGT